MPRMTLSFDVTDEQLASLLARAGSTGQMTAGDGDGDGDGGTAPANYDPNERDSAGIPWINGIHANTRGKTNTGLWRGAKGVTNEQRTAAEAPYKLPAQAPVPPFMTGNQPPIPIMQTPPAPVPAMPMPGMPMPTMPVAAPPVTYEQMIHKVQDVMSRNKISGDQFIQVIYPACGITDPASLMTDESGRARIMAEIAKYDR